MMNFRVPGPQNTQWHTVSTYALYWPFLVPIVSARDLKSDLRIRIGTCVNIRACKDRVLNDPQIQERKKERKGKKDPERKKERKRERERERKRERERERKIQQKERQLEPKC